jgi:hypothetical protein
MKVKFILPALLLAVSSLPAGAADNMQIIGQTAYPKPAVMPVAPSLTVGQAQPKPTGAPQQSWQQKQAADIAAAQALAKNPAAYDQVRLQQQQAYEQKLKQEIADRKAKQEAAAKAKQAVQAQGQTAGAAAATPSSR